MPLESMNVSPATSMTTPAGSSCSSSAIASVNDGDERTSISPDSTTSAGPDPAVGETSMCRASGTASLTAPPSDRREQPKATRVDFGSGGARAGVAVRERLSP